jgi:glycosyltransferase involved in cell wall biosynthesis
VTMVETRSAVAPGPEVVGKPMSRATLPLTAVVLTMNEEANLAACLKSLAGWTADLVVVDSGSTDGTVQIAREHGARVLVHPFETHALQWRWALAQLPTSTGWVFGLDADQRVMPELRAELERTLASVPPNVAGLYVKRRQVFRGRWIKHGGYYPKYLLKLFRLSAVRVDDGDLMDHRFYVEGRTEKLSHDIIEDNQNERDIAFWVAKHNRYAVRHAREESQRRDDSRWPVAPRFFGTPDERSAWLKRAWYRLPLYVRPALYFFYRYVLRFGWMDGKQGFVFHFLHAFWYRLLIDIHLDAEPTGPGART